MLSGNDVGSEDFCRARLRASFLGFGSYERCLSEVKEAYHRPKMRVIQGGLDCQTRCGPIRIVAAPENSPPFEVDARAFEEDTFLIMSADPKVCEPEEHPIRLMTELIECKPETVGSVVVKGQKPLRFLAIVHDVNQDPTWKPEWIESALKEIFCKAEQHKLQSVGIPLLGTLHGKLEENHFVELLAQALRCTAFFYLKRLWLIAPAGFNINLIKMLKAALKQVGTP